jgi:gliding motility-associated-like protein
MKKPALVIALIALYFGFTPNTSASHLAGAEINYTYIGDTTGIPHQYLVSLQIYRDLTGIPLNTNNQELCVSSACFGNQTYIFDFKPVLFSAGGNARQALPVPGLTECVDTNDPDLVYTEIYFFTKVVTLSGNCADWKFSWHDNARNTNQIDNLTFGATGADLFVEALLNNTLGNNSSPVFINPAAKSFCVGSPFVWSQAAIEPDGDSLYYDFGNPLVSAIAPVCVTPSNATFANGYSISQPMSTTGGITIDHRYGTFRFTPAQIENVVINVIVQEYRFDNTFMAWRLIGNTVRDLQIPVVGSCKPAATSGPRLDPQSVTTECWDTDSLRGFGFPKISNDSIATASGYCFKMPVVPYNCFNNTVTMRFDIEVLCESISEDGSEFRIIGPDSTARPVVGVVKNCQTDLTTKEIELVLHKPLDINGNYILQVKPGNDGNTFANRCGFELDPYYMMIIRVNDCPTPSYSLQNVSVNLDREIDIDWEIDINSFEPLLFTAWNILRANSNGQFYILESLNHPNAVNLRSYKDTSVTAQDVDLTQFQYMIQLVQNGTAYPPSNIIHSILLSGTEKLHKQGMDYNWTTYDGWTDPHYELEYGRFNTSTNQVDWANFNGPTLAYQNEEYIYPSCQVNKDTSGLYAFRVLATNPRVANSFTSESNWLYYEIKCPDNPGRGNLTAEIPSVFTPDGDGLNDIFKLKTNFENADVAIYNRWGKLVYESSGKADIVAWDGLDKTSGTMVADGVYYYVVGLSGKIDDGQGGKEDILEDRTGSLTLFSNGTK